MVAAKAGVDAFKEEKTEIIIVGALCSCLWFGLFDVFLL